MNILFITDLYPLTDDDLRTSFALKDFVSDFISKGHNVQIIRPNFILNGFIRGKKFYKTGLYQDVYNVNFFTPFLFNINKKLPPLKPYDVIVSHMPSGNILANKLNGKRVCGVHNSDIKILIEPVYSVYFKPQLLKAFRHAEKLICRSYSVEKKLLALYPEFREKTVVIMSGIDEKYIIKKPLEFSNKLKILTCANLIKRKNIDKLIFAVKDMTDVELTVIGNGKEYKRLKNISPNVIFTGRLGRSEVLTKMQTSDVFILPSVDETLGLVYLEAMASGCITVGIKNEGIDGFITDGENGFLTEPHVETIRNTIEKIELLDRNSLEKISQNCYNSVKACSSMDCSDKYLKTLVNII